MPHAEYQIMGTIRAQDSGEPIAGIQLTVTDTAFTQTLDTAYTDSDGRYLLAFSDAPWFETWRLSIRDVDGGANGASLSKDTIACIPQSSLTGKDASWFAGHGNDTVDVKLERDPG